MPGLWLNCHGYFTMSLSWANLRFAHKKTRHNDRLTARVLIIPSCGAMSRQKNWLRLSRLTDKRCQKSSGCCWAARFFVTAFLRCVTDRRMPCQGNFRVSANHTDLPVTGQMDCVYYNHFLREWKMLVSFKLFFIWASITNHHVGVVILPQFLPALFL